MKDRQKELQQAVLFFTLQNLNGTFFQFPLPFFGPHLGSWWPLGTHVCVNSKCTQNILFWYCLAHRWRYLLDFWIRCIRLFSTVLCLWDLVKELLSETFRTVGSRNCLPWLCFYLCFFVRKASIHPLQVVFGYNINSACFHSTSHILWINYKARRGIISHWLYMLILCMDMR